LGTNKPDLDEDKELAAIFGRLSRLSEGLVKARTILDELEDSLPTL
jgi:hypothetical protein